MKAFRLRSFRSERAFEKVFRAERAKQVAPAWSMSNSEEVAVELVQGVFFADFDN